MDKVLIFDLCTKKSYDDVGGKKSIGEMGIAASGIYDYSTDTFTTYNEENVDALIKELLNAKLVVGINLKKFCYKVLSGFTDQDFSNVKTLDILESIKKKLSFKPKIEGLFAGTLEIKKSIKNEINAPRLFKQSKIEEVEQLCEENIIDVKRLFDFGREKGYIFYNDATSQRWKISVNW